MVSDHLFKLCETRSSVTSVHDEHPEQSPEDIFKQLYGHKTLEHHKDSGHHERLKLSSAEAEQMLRCGQWGPTQPSPLFLQAFAEALACLDADPASGVISPPMMGTNGSVPLTVIAPLLDNIRHCSNMIVQAEKQVFFITSVWQPSAAQRMLSDALVELSRRAGLRRQRVQVRIMFDKFAVGNVMDPHRPIQSHEWTSRQVMLPSSQQMPNVDLEVMSFHQLPFGTLHSKFCVVDRKMAAVMSNNVEDNDNLEMLTHLEGPVVDSLYDSALIIWGKHGNVPARDLSTASGNEPALSKEPEKEKTLPESLSGEAMDEHAPASPHYDSDLDVETERMLKTYAPKDGETIAQAVNRQLSVTAKNPPPVSGPEIHPGEEMLPFVRSTLPSPVPMALVSRSAYGPLGKDHFYVPQNQAWLSLIRNAQRNIFIQTPDLNSSTLLPALSDAVKRGVEVTYYVCFGYNDAGEIIPGQGGSNEQAARALLDSLPADGPERGRLHIYHYVGKDQNRPIHQSFKSRSCHIKLLIADDAVGVQGSGNQDTQSWFHSLEVNVMVDSPEICASWRRAIERNQNTQRFGRVAGDGVWRDEEGNPRDGYVGDPGVVGGLFWGVRGMTKKIWEASGL